MAEVRIVEWSRGFVSRLGDLRDQVLSREGALKRRKERGDVNRTRADRAQRTAGLAHSAVIPGDRDRHPEDRKVKGRPAAQLPVGARHLAT